MDTTVLHHLRVRPGHGASLAERDTAWRGPETDGLSKEDRKAFLDEQLDAYVDELKRAQEVLWASDRYALLVVFQAMDAAGKDGTIKHVMSGVNPQGCRVVSFAAPTHLEVDHDFLWRCGKELPERGRIGIFNRSYYEEVLIARVHPELLAAQKLPSDQAPPIKPEAEFWAHRFESINAFEHHLHRNGTRIVKFFLHLSKAEQKRRFLARLDDPAKHWKFSAADVAERKHWDEYQQAYEEAITATSTHWAPWYVVPADHKPTMRALVAGVIADVVGGLDLRYPELDADGREALALARAELEAE